MEVWLSGSNVAQANCSADLTFSEFLLRQPGTYEQLTDDRK